MSTQPKIQKLLALTESSNDHEALNALRRVQQILTGPPAPTAQDLAVFELLVKN